MAMATATNKSRQGAWIALMRAQRAREMMQCLTPKKNIGYEERND